MLRTLTRTLTRWLSHTTVRVAVAVACSVAVLALPALVMAQQVASDSSAVVIVTGTPWWVQLLTLVSVFLTGLLTKYGWDWIEKGLAFLNDPTKVNPMLKPLLVSGLAFLIGTVGSLVGAALPGDITVWTPDTVTKVLAGAFGILIHLASKRGEEKKAVLAGAVPVT